MTTDLFIQGSVTHCSNEALKLLLLLGRTNKRMENSRRGKRARAMQQVAAAALCPGRNGEPWPRGDATRQLQMEMPCIYSSRDKE
jgi:hypothetical protein